MKIVTLFGLLFIIGIFLTLDIVLNSINFQLYPNGKKWHPYPQPQCSNKNFTLINSQIWTRNNCSKKIQAILRNNVTSDEEREGDNWCPSNAYLKKECYMNYNITANNICCKMHQYTANDFQFCANETLRKNKRFSMVFVGDSRLRQIFNSFGYLLRNTTMTYTKGDKHGNISDVLRGLMYQKPHTKITIGNEDLEIIFYWDPHLNKMLPKLLDHWIKNSLSQPNILVLECGTHPLNERSTAAFGYLKKMWRDLLPSLSELAQNTHTIVKLTDPVLVKTEPNKSRATRLSNENIDYINSILQKLFNKYSNDIMVWTATIPLSNQYIQQCYRNKVSTRDLLWMCKDNTHIGYIVIHQMRNMILNSYCNRYLKLDVTYCI